MGEQEEALVDLALRRRAFAEEIRTSMNLQTAALVDALAAVPREQFLRPGPWTIRGEAEAGRPVRQTPDSDPSHLYQNVSVAIDPERQLFNGGPGAVVPWIDALSLGAGHRVLHVGCGLGYYTALMAHVVGPTGRVLALEVDSALATEASHNLGAFGWVEVRNGDGSDPLQEIFDAVVIHAGVTHPLDAWLDALAAGGRMILPLTATMPQMGPLGKGMTFLLTNEGEWEISARPLNFVAIYSAIGVRDEALNAAIGRALMRGSTVPATRLRRDHHQPEDSCWLHGPTFCLDTL
jgi:protein-L-isoaspartate(D-aspartate) O-methyltransferase